MASLAFLDRFGLNPRERRLAGVLMVVFAAFLVLGLPLGLEAYVQTRRHSYEDLRAALSGVQGARAEIRERQQKKDAVLQRYRNAAPALAGYLEQVGREQKLQVTDSQDRPEVPHGKRYVERNTVIHFKKSGMLAIVKFLESIEKSGYPTTVNRLNIRKRGGEADSWDVEVGVSAFDRSEPKVEKKEEKP